MIMDVNVMHMGQNSKTLYVAAASGVYNEKTAEFGYG